MHHGCNLVVAHGVHTTVCQHIEVNVESAQTESVETTFLQGFHTTFNWYEVKFLHYSYFVQFEGHIATFVEFYITHKYNLFILNIFKIAPKVILIFQIRAKRR